MPLLSFHRISSSSCRMTTGMQLHRNSSRICHFWWRVQLDACRVNAVCGSGAGNILSGAYDGFLRRWNGDGLALPKHACNISLLPRARIPFV